MKNPWKRIIHNMKASSRRRYHVSEKQTQATVNNTRVYAITVTEQDLQEIFHEQGGKCFWLGIELDPHGVFVSGNPLAISVDRLDNSRDYERSNIVLTTRFANLGRGNTPADEFSKIVDEIMENIRSQNKV